MWGRKVCGAFKEALGGVNKNRCWREEREEDN